jgi:anti-sigma factor RsiW
MTENKLNENIVTAQCGMADLIPWYVNGTLSAAEQSDLEQHLAVCEPCQREALRCQSLVDELPTSQDTWKPTPAHFASILANVDQMEKAALKPDINHTKAKPGFLRRMGTWYSQTPRPVRWTLAFETFAFALLALFLVLPHSPIQNTNGIYETLSDVESPAATKGASIRLVFSDDMTTQELFELLKQAKAQIRQGPSEVGSYTVEVESAEKTRSLTLLRANPKVRLAQLVE